MTTSDYARRVLAKLGPMPASTQQRVADVVTGVILHQLHDEKEGNNDVLSTDSAA